jgi:hypothetical protein
VPSPAPSDPQETVVEISTVGRGDLFLPIERLLVPRSHSKGVVPDEFESMSLACSCSTEGEVLLGAAIHDLASCLAKIVPRKTFQIDRILRVACLTSFAVKQE